MQPSFSFWVLIIVQYGFCPEVYTLLPGDIVIVISLWTVNVAVCRDSSSWGTALNSLSPPLQLLATSYDATQDYPHSFR